MRFNTVIVSLLIASKCSHQGHSSKITSVLHCKSYGVRRAAVPDVPGMESGEGEPMILAAHLFVLISSNLSIVR